MRNPFWIAASVSLTLMLGLLLLLRDHSPGPGAPGGGPESASTLHFYCAMGLNEPVRKIIKEYEERTGVKVRVTFSGSKNLLSPMKLDQRADLYLAANDTYMDVAEEAGIEIRETIPIAHQRPVIVVNKKNPHKIEKLEDLTQPGLRLFLANPDFAAIGKVSRSILGPEKWRKLWDKRKTDFETVTEVAQQVNVEPTGVGVIWDANVKQYPDLKFVRAPEFEQNKSLIVIGVLGRSDQPTQALHFARFLAAADRGLKTLQDAGYDTVEGDYWADKPSIFFYSGGLNREAVIGTLQAFEKREGAQIKTMFAGCGFLVGRMNPDGLAERPDIYFACANEYMNRVRDLFYEPMDVSGTDLVIGVPHGKQDVAKLADLAKPGLKVGLCDARQSALGALSRRLLEKHDLREAVERNARDYAGTAPALIAKLSADALDAAIVYRANATSEAKHGRVDIVPINDPLAYARQPIAVGRFSRHFQLCERLVRAILAADSRRRFEALGFDWYGEGAADN